MVQIIEENRPRSLSTRFGDAFGKAAEVIPSFMDKRYKMDAENEALKQQTGLNFAGISDPRMRQEGYSNALKGQAEDKKLRIAQDLKQGEKDLKIQEEMAPLIAGLETVNKMRQLRNGGKLGRGSGVLAIARPDIARDRGEYEQLGKSLISLATNIPIRNRIEFETLAEKLYDPSLQDGEAEGVLDAMEQIIKGNLNSFSSNKPDAKPEKKQRRDLIHFGG